MSATLDLAGATHTIAADATEAYYQVKDTVGGGSLVMSAGSKIVFDDASGAGFSGSGFSIVINGNSGAPCTIESAGDEPYFEWAYPDVLISMTATRCYFIDGTGPTSSTWVLNNCSFSDIVSDASTWCSITDLQNATGTALDEDTLYAIIRGAEREINARLSPLNITGSTDLREASLHLSIARLYTRYHLVGQLTSGEVSSSIANHEAMAWQLVDKYISAQDRTRDIKTWVRVG